MHQLFARFWSWMSRTATATSKQPAARRTRPGLEMLEDRLVPAHIVWDNYLSDGFDLFNNLTPQSATVDNATLARNIVFKAIEAWEKVLPGDEVDEIGCYATNDLPGIDGSDLAKYNSVTDTISFKWTKPWFLDPTPWDYSEFNHAEGLFERSNGPQYQFDLYSVALHEIGHAMGLDHNSVTGDLMTEDGLPKGTRRLISNTNAAYLDDDYASVKTPSSIPGFSSLSSFDPNTGDLIIHGDFHPSGDPSPSVLLRRSGSNLLVAVNGYTISAPFSSVNHIRVLLNDPFDMSAPGGNVTVDLRYGNPIPPIWGLEIEGEFGENSLQVVGSSSAEAFTLTGNETLWGNLLYTPAGNIGFNNIDSVVLDGRGGDDSITVEGTSGIFDVKIYGELGEDTFFVEDVASYTDLTVFGQAGNDTYYVGDGSLTDLQGNLTVHGEDGMDDYDELIVRDQYQPTGRLYGLGADSLTWDLQPTMHFDGIAHLRVHGSSAGGSLFAVDAVPTGVTVAFFGGSGVDALQGAPVSNLWKITQNNQGTLNSSVSFYSVEHLSGRSGNDVFQLNNGKGVSSLIEGGGGFDTLDYGLYTTSVTVNLQAATATDTGGIFDIDKVIGSQQVDNLIGPNQDALWRVLITDNAGTLEYGGVPGQSGYTTTFRFVSIENLTGGWASDTFQFGNGRKIAGALDAGLGDDTLDYSAYTTGVTIDLSKISGPGGLTGFETVKGGFGLDTLKGMLSPLRYWDITGLNTGVLQGLTTVHFEGIESLSGNLTNNGGFDLFRFWDNGQLTGTIDGGMGSDQLSYSQRSGPVTVNLGNYTATALSSFQSIETFIGS